MAKKSSPQTSHDAAVSIIEKLVKEHIGGIFNATAICNQCSEELTINLVNGVVEVQREKLVGTVRPDISLHDENDIPIRFIEVVDSHAPERNVHDFALHNGIEVVEFHLRADRAFTGRRRNRALDESLTIKTRLQELNEGRLVVDAHNLLCQRPKCRDCGSPLPLRTVTISTTDCWKCGQNVNVVTGDIDGHSLEQDFFTKEEMKFAEENGVLLARRFSATAGGKYLANVCTNCDQIQGNWFLYMDPLHDRFNLFRTKRENYGPCEKCATRHCWSHGEYQDYQGTNQCPDCLDEAERVMCPNRPDRECFYPHRCSEGGCYFVNREEQLQKIQQGYAEEAALRQQQDLQREEEKAREWQNLSDWINQRRIDQDKELQ